MKAYLLERHGSAERLRISEVPTPQPGAGEVRVRVRWIGLNFAEVLSRRGVYGWAPPLPYILGMEAFGEIDALGSDVRTHRYGDRVMVGTKYGTYAEYVTIPAERALQPPSHLSDEESAAFAVNYLTAWIGLMEMARLRPSDTLLVTSAAGGVGSAAVQLASRYGATVIGAAGRGKEETVLRLGAAHAINYHDTAWESHLRAVAPRGADAVLEMGGGAIYRAAIRNVAPLGRVVIAGASGSFPSSRNLLARAASLRNLPRASIFDMLRRSYGVMSFHVGWLLEEGVIAPHWANLVQFAEKHAIRPLIGATFPFGELAAAHRALEEKTTVGKVLVKLP